MERAIDLPIGVDDNIILKIGDLLTILGLGARYRLDQNGRTRRAHAFGWVSTTADFGMVSAPERRASMRYLCWL